ncbi:MAG TPA: hypothetical protein VHU80_14280 [Polyangiaceae bacterium]|nr:hypothetical protein [Polyangiaceae bacterium]
MRGAWLDPLRVAATAFALVACSGGAARDESRDASASSSRTDGAVDDGAAGGAGGTCGACTDAQRAIPDAAPPPHDGGLIDGSAEDAAHALRDAAAEAAAQDAGAEAAADAASNPEGYPRGHYGTQVGDILPFLRWQGYVDASGDGGLVSDGPFSAYSSDDMRRSGKRLALLHVADFDCPGCNHAVTVLATGAHAVEERGALVVEVLGSFEFTNAADRKHLDAWIGAYDLTMTSVIDAPGHPLTTLNDVGVRETALVVDPTTMRVVFRMTGDLAGIGPASLSGAFAYLDDHLAP